MAGGNGVEGMAGASIASSACVARCVVGVELRPRDK